jgi:gamma-glutamyltranspeptidase/glutathione hydrolase
VFSSDRGGNFDLWRLPLGADGASGEPQRITSTPEAETQPNVAADGRIAFVRGFGGASRVWIRAADGTEKRLTDRELAESAPAFSPDGLRVAFVGANELTRRIVVRTVADNRETIANADRNADRLAWSPSGDRIAFTSIAARSPVFVAPPDGRWTNTAATVHGDLAWSPDGRTLAVAEHDENTPGYNGDPERLGDRVAAESFATTRDRLLLLNAPLPVDAGLAPVPLTTTRDRAARNADAYDRAWARSNALYFTAANAADRRAQWESVKAKYRAGAIAAKNDEELERAIHAMLRERPPLKNSATGRAAVSSAHPVSTEAGLEIFRLGGNVVDAAVAVSFALGVVEPDASGVGGYGQMVLYLNKMERPTLFEFMSRVPEDAGLSNTSLMVNGRYPNDGPVLPNVPGTVAGMHSAWKKFGSGKVAWKDILAPAIRAAREGYVVSEGLATTLSTEREHFLKYEGSRALFFRNGKPLVAGDTLKNPDLAWVLTQIAEKGADGFYRGDVAKKYVDDLHGKGNAMKMTDMARYFAPEREPVSGAYRGFTVYSSAPPVSGGADLVGKLNMLEQFEKPKAYPEDPATFHAMLASWSLVAGGRVADPGLWPVVLDGYVSKDTAKLRWRCYSPDHAVRPGDVRTDSGGCASPNPAPARMSAPPTELASAIHEAPVQESPCGAEHAAEVEFCHAAGTTAFTVADADGNVVAVTQTLGTWGGNFYVTPGLGFLSNDKLTSYGTDPNAFGARLPFARHGSTLAPTIAFKGKKPVFAVGAAGNAWITSAVYQTLVGSLDFGLDPQRALELPRFLPGGRGGGAAFAPPPAGGAGGAPAAAGGAAPTGGRGAGAGGGRSGAAGPPGPVVVTIEDGFNPDVLKRMRELGYDFNIVSLKGELREGYGAAISLDGKKVTAGADPRRAGAAGAVP